MDYSALEKLLTIPKKTDASKAKKEQFKEQMMELFGEQGVTKQSIEYLKKGFGFSGVSPLADFYKSTPKELKRETAKAILDTGLLNCQDRQLSFKAGIGLLASCFGWCDGQGLFAPNR